jgi:adenylate kinase
VGARPVYEGRLCGQSVGAIIVTGIPGVGKTTVMEAAASQANAKIVVYGTQMFEVASAKGLVEHRDDMRKLHPDVQKEVQMAAAKNMAAMGDIIVDTHCTIKTAKGYLPGLPAWVLDQLKPSSIVLVEADPAEIKGRRESDATRIRDADSLESIAEHQEINRRFAAAYSVLTGATVHTVYNHDGKVDDAIQQILPVVA